MTTAQSSPPPHALQTTAMPPASESVASPRRKGSSPKIEKQSTEYILKSGLAGGLAGCAAKTLVGPLDRVKILFQASNPQFAKYTGSWFGVATAMKDIWRMDGARGLFRGHSATLLRIFPYAGIKFLAYEQIRAIVIKDKTQETPIRRFLSGSLAGSISVLFTYPLEVIRVRLAFETKHDSRSTLSSICRRIYNEHPPPPQGNTVLAAPLAKAASATVPRNGLANFYRGFGPTLLGMLPYAGSSFLAHDTMSDFLRRPEMAAYTALPHTQGSKSDPNKPVQLRYWAELFTGGFAGFVSQTLSYPLEVIRRRMQVGAVVGDGHRLRIGETARRIYSERGWRGFFIGLGIGYVKVIPMVAMSFYVYERSKYMLGI